MNVETSHFIHQHAEDDVRKLALAAHKYPDVDMPFALQQITGRQTAQRKLPSWTSNDELLYPPHLSMEQCSSEQTAHYKAKLAWQCVQSDFQNKVEEQSSTENTALLKACSLVDLTGGLGVDFSFMALPFHEAVYVERQRCLCDIAQHNLPLLGVSQAQVVCCEGEQYLQTMQPATVIYLDPARRNDAGAKTVAISDCTPNLLSLLVDLLRKSWVTLVKLSPMLDWHQAVVQLNTLSNCVRQVHIIAVNNECKELLFVLSHRWQSSLAVHCVNNEQTFVFYPQQTVASPKMSVPIGSHLIGQYLYEPNAALMKAGCFVEIAQQFQVDKIAPNSHLYVSGHEVADFPGRKFRIKAISSMNKKMLKTQLASIRQANIATRNFPLSVAELRKRLKIREGGEVYIFATTDVEQNHWLLIGEKLRS